MLETPRAAATTEPGLLRRVRRRATRRERHHGYHALIDRLEIELALRYARGARVLEAGCGTGLILRRSRPHARAGGRARPVAGHAGARARARGLDVVQASITDLPFADGDVRRGLLVQGAGARRAASSAALAELARVVRPGGHVLAEFYNPWSLRDLVKRLKRADARSRGAPPTRRSTRATTRSPTCARYPAAVAASGRPARRARGDAGLARCIELPLVGRAVRLPRGQRRATRRCCAASAASWSWSREKRMTLSARCRRDRRASSSSTTSARCASSCASPRRAPATRSTLAETSPARAPPLRRARLRRRHHRSQDARRHRPRRARRRQGARAPHTQVIVVTAFATPETAIAAMKRGAYDYLTKPFKVDEIGVGRRARAREARAAARQRRAARRARRALPPRPHGRQVAARCSACSSCSRKVAPAKTSVLHHRRVAAPARSWSRARCTTCRRARRRAVRRRQLRRHPRDAARARAVRPRARRVHRRASPTSRGLFAAADGGTLFLDEIGELSARAAGQAAARAAGAQGQARSAAPTRREVDVRVVAATNRDLEAEVERGALPRATSTTGSNVIQLHLPPLRARREDIPLLAEHFLAQARRRARPPDRRHRARRADARSCDYDYPGQRARAGEPDRARGHARAAATASRARRCPSCSRAAARAGRRRRRRASPTTASTSSAWSATSSATCSSRRSSAPSGVRKRGRQAARHLASARCATASPSSASPAPTTTATTKRPTRRSGDRTCAAR